MRPFVESLRRLFVAGRLILEKVQSFLTAGKINDEEYAYIVRI